MFEDSSGEDSQATCGIDTGSEPSNVLQSKDPEGVPAVSTNELFFDSVSIYEDGEKSLMEMTDEERDYFQRYRDSTKFKCLSLISTSDNFIVFFFFLANQAQLTSLKCTICSCQLFTVNPENIRIHPALGVLVCKVSFFFCQLARLFHQHAIFNV